MMFSLLHFVTSILLFVASLVSTMPQKYEFVAAYSRENVHGVFVAVEKTAPFVYYNNSTP